MIVTPIRILFNLARKILGSIVTSSSSPSSKQKLLLQLQRCVIYISKHCKDGNATVFYRSWFKEKGAFYVAVMSLGELAKMYPGDDKLGLFSKDEKTMQWKNNIYELLYSLVKVGSLRTTTQYPGILQKYSKQESLENLYELLYNMFYDLQEKYPNNLNFRFTTIEFGLRSAEQSNNIGLLDKIDILLQGIKNDSKVGTVFSQSYDFYTQEAERIRPKVENYDDGR